MKTNKILRLLAANQANRSSATQPFLVSSRNVTPSWKGALRDDIKNGCVAD